jgi:hypothetical protein
MDGGINFSPTNVGEIPIPSPFVSRELLCAVKEIVALRERTGPDVDAADEKRLASLMDALDEEVFRLYRLCDKEKAAICGDAVAPPRRSVASR